ncbi:MAG: flavodoxin family protein [Oceanospirillaceae bacterium]|nr:flavodoxin family protein [Oceanospirillaceae bacterium]
MKKLLVIAHAPSDNTIKLRDAILAGITKQPLENIHYQCLPPLQATPEDVLSCDAIILGTTENLGYMSGALKDFFDRIYYPCLERKQGLPFSYYIRAGHDGTGTNLAIQNICNGLKWKQIQPEVICRGSWRDDFLDDCTNLGENIACGLDFGIY